MHIFPHPYLIKLILFKDKNNTKFGNPAGPFLAHHFSLPAERGRAESQKSLS
jgi:hypothetical protein